jgi:hypothetical protein
MPIGMQPAGPAHPERSFGVSIGGVMLVYAALTLWRGHVTRAEVVGGLGAGLVLAGLIVPRLLRWPSAVWWTVARFLGYWNARILLTVLFGLILVPVSAMWRLTGRDPLTRKRAGWAGWTPYPERYRDRAHFARMF